MFNKLKYYYKHPKVLLGKIKRKIVPLPSVTVIIPTYKRIPYFNEAIESVQNQNYNRNRIKIIVVVNGSDVNYYEEIKLLYRNQKNIKVLYTEEAGLNHARYFGLNFVKTKFVTFLDDDDYFSKNYLYELLLYVSVGTKIICGKLFDYEKGKPLDFDTYINVAISKIDKKYTDDYFQAGSLLSNICAKVYDTKYFKSLEIVPQTLSHTEDIPFWVRNVDRLKVKIRIVDKNSKEGYFRRIVENSMSRPTENKEKFYIVDRLYLINLFEEELFKSKNDLLAKRFILNKISSQAELMYRYYDSVSFEEKKRLLNLINKSGSLFLNKSKFGLEKGIAFCHNFPPFVDASSYVAAKRLSKISELSNTIINWDVISADMNGAREKDLYFNMFYASMQYTNITILPGKAYFNEKAQDLWGKLAYESVKDKEYKYIYSRSMWAGSHLAAYLYKKNHPSVIWYAEFSDPIYMDTNNAIRKTACVYSGKDEYLNNFWYDIEKYVFELADKIIFTNNSQKEYMLSYRKEEILDKENRLIVLNHPLIDKKYSKIINSNYELLDFKINIGFFGNFYKNRNGEDLFKFLENPNVVVHLFSSNCDEIMDVNRIVKNKPVSNLEFLNIASKMDYLFLNDINFEGDINPYLPSKLADYLSVSTPVIAKINKGTELQKYNSKNIIKVYSINSNFVNNLKKKDNTYDFDVIDISYYKELYTNIALKYEDISKDILDFKVNLGFNSLEMPKMYSHNKIIWKFENNFSNTFYLYYYGLRMVYILVKSFLINGNVEYLNKAKEIVVSFYDFFTNEDKTNNMFFNDHTQAERIENIVFYYSIMSINNKLDKRDKEICLNIIRDALDKLFDNQYYQIKHNHGILVDKACLIALSFLKEFDKVDYIKSRLEKQILYAFGKDGVHIENSVDYHFTVVQNIMFCNNILNYIGKSFDSNVSSVINNIYEYMIYCYKPNGRLILFGDSKDDCNNELNKQSYGVSRLEYIVNKGLSGTKPKDLIKFFKSGYLFMREHFEKENFENSTYLAIKAGFETRVHKHQDDLSLCLYSKGHDIFIDAGMYNYIPNDPIKDYMESVSAHSTVCVKDKTYSIAVGNGDKFKILSYRQDKDYDYALCYSRVYADVLIYRNVYYFRKLDVIVIQDNIYSSNSDTYLQYFHLGEDVVIDKYDLNILELSLKASDYKVYINQLNQLDDFRILDGLKTFPYSLVSKGFEKYKETKSLEYVGSGKDYSFLSVIDIVNQEKCKIEIKNEKMILRKNHKKVEFELKKQEYLSDDVSDVLVEIENGILKVINNNLKDKEHCIYLFTDLDIYKMSYTKKSQLDFDCKNLNNIYVMYYLKNKFGAVKNGFLCYLNNDNGLYDIKKYNKLCFPKVISHDVQKVNSKYIFKVNIDYDYESNYRWYIYCDGVRIYYNENKENIFEYEFVNSGNYVVMVSSFNKYFKEFDFYQFDSIKVE